LFVPSAVQLLKFPEVGVPSTGVVNDALVDKTTFPDPVVAIELKFLLPSVATIFDAVKPEKLALVVDKTPDNGLNVSLEEETFAVVMLLAVALVKVM